MPWTKKARRAALGTISGRQARHDESVRPYLERAKAARMTLAATCAYLNAEQVRTPSGSVSDWKPEMVRRIMERLFAGCEATADLFDG